jgi:hypothetical protein
MERLLETKFEGIDPLSEHIGYLSPAEIACFHGNKRFPPGIDR